MSKLTALKRRSAAVDVALALREAIMTGQLAFGEPIIEQVVCDDLQVSRTPLREALRELQGEGLVEVTPYKGARVFQLKAEEMTLLGSFRRVLEEAALDFAMQSDAPGIKSDLEEVLRRMAVCIEDQNCVGYGQLDTDFHAVIFARSGNPYLIEAQNSVGRKIEALRNRIQYDKPGVHRSIVQHRAIFEAVKAGHARRAKLELGEHVEKGTRYFRDHLAIDTHLVVTA